MELNPNYLVPSGSALNKWLGESSAELGERDTNAALQMILHFSAGLSMITERGEAPRVLETGIGLSTQIFAESLKVHDSSQLVSIDYGGTQAALSNSRGSFTGSVGQNTAGNLNFNPVHGVSVSLAETQAAWGKLKNRDLRGISHFIDLRLETRRIRVVEDFLGHEVSGQAVAEELLKNGFDSKLFDFFRYPGDEFEVLKGMGTLNPVLEHQIGLLNPNLVFLDSGEFSTLAEFDIVDAFATPGCLLLVQDILFPKSIKGFIIGSELLNSDHWSVLWVDRSTPQGMLLAIRR